MMIIDGEMLICSDETCGHRERKMSAVWDRPPGEEAERRDRGVVPGLYQVCGRGGEVQVHDRGVRAGVVRFAR